MSKQQPLPVGYIEVAGQRVTASDTVVAHAIELWQRQLAGKDLKAEQDQLKADLLEGYKDLDPAAAIVIPGICRVTLKRGAVKRVIKDIAAVRALLGARFGDLVDSKTSYNTTAKLDAIIDDDRDELGLALRDFVATTVAEPTVAIVAA